MKIFLILLVISNFFATNADFQSFETNILNNSFVSSSQAEKYFLHKKVFDCSLKAQVEEVYASLKESKAPVVEISVFQKEGSTSTCQLHFKNYYRFDIKPKSLDEFKKLIKVSFDQLIGSLIQAKLTVCFNIKSDSFFYDPANDAFVFSDVHQIAYSLKNKEKLSDEEFKTQMDDRLGFVLTLLRVSDLNLDFELTDFNIHQDQLLEDTLIEKYRKKDLKDSNEGNQIQIDN